MRTYYARKLVTVQFRLAVQGIQEDFQHLIDQLASLPRFAELLESEGENSLWRAASMQPAR